MLKLGLRTETAENVKKFLKTAQQAAPIPQPKVTDAGPEGAPGAPAPGAPPAAPPKKPAAPGAPPDEEKMDLGKEKLEDGGVKGLENKLEEFSEDVTDALKDIKTILKKKLLTDEDKEDEFGDFKDKEKELEEEDLSVDEFGLEPESLVLSNEEDGMQKTSLRAKRLKRIAEYGDGGAETLSEEFNLEKDKKERFKPKVPPVQITKVKKDENIGWLKLSELSMKLHANKAAWDVLNKEDTPLFTIEQPEGMQEETFATKEFAEGVIKDMQKMGILKGLKKYHAKKAAKEEDEKAEKKDKKDEKDEKDMKKESALAAADFKRRFVKALSLANVAMAKNLVNQGVHPLKATLYELMTKVGNLSDEIAQGIIESGFATSAQEATELVLNQADEYMKMSDESFVEYEAAIGELEPQAPRPSEGQEEVFEPKGASLKRKASEGSLLVTSHTQGENEREDRLSKLNAAFASQGVLPGTAGISRHANLIRQPKQFV